MEEETVQNTVEPIEPIETIVEQPEPVVAPEVVELPELLYSYQPTDDQGRSLGGRQVIKYRTQEELVQKITDQNVHLVRALREQTRKQRLGIMDNEDIPAEAPRFDTPLNFQPRVLTPDERVQLSRDLLDPERFEEASGLLIESTLGATPEKLRAKFNQMSQNELSLLAKVESDAFMQANPDYYGCRANFDAITGWMVKNDLQPVRQNFQLAYDTLRRLPNGGIMVGKPEEVNEPVVPVREPIEPVAPEVPAPVPVVPKVVPPPSGLRSDGGSPAPQRAVKYTLAQINKMSGDEYKQKLLHEKGFPQIVAQLEQDAAKRSRGQV